MRRARLVVGWLGVVLLVRGVLGTLTDPGTHLVGELVFLATVLIAHDGVVLPLAVGVGAVLARWAPASVRGPAQAGLFATLMLTVVALPFVVGAGASPDNPSALPLDYRRGLLIALVAVWVTVGSAAGFRLIAARRRGSGERDGRD